MRRPNLSQKRPLAHLRGEGNWLLLGTRSSFHQRRSSNVGTHTPWKPKLGPGRFRRKAFDERIHLAKHVCFVGTKQVVIRMRQPNDPRGWQPLFKRFCHRSLKSEIGSVSLSTLSRISYPYPSPVRESVNREDKNIDPRVFLHTCSNGFTDSSAWVLRLRRGRFRGRVIVGVRVPSV